MSRDFSAKRHRPRPNSFTVASQKGGVYESGNRPNLIFKLRLQQADGTAVESTGSSALHAWRTQNRGYSMPFVIMTAHHHLICCNSVSLVSAMLSFLVKALVNVTPHVTGGGADS